MKTRSIPASLLILLLAPLQVSPSLRAEDLEDTARDPGAREEQAYHQAIVEIESREGAYGGNLAESLLGLAHVLQAQGRHEEAIEVFRRGTHLTRVNEGLYSEAQIPMLQGEINSYRARGDYPLVDERQNYLYRVQLQSLEGSERMTDALMSQAQWQFEAYQRGLGGSESYYRLVNMLELYSMAMEDVNKREGDVSPRLLPPLQGMLQAQYLISSHEVRDPDQLFGDEGRPNETLLRFKSHRKRSYRQGRAIISAIADIEAAHTGDDPTTQARSMVMLGDWHLWNGQTEDAWEAYRAAQMELAGIDGAQEQEQSFFREPVALPDYAELSPLPPAVAPEQGDILLAFNVSESGRVYDIERMDEAESESRRASRLMRRLRNTQFRPRFEAGQPVETEKLVKAFDIQ